MQIPNVGGRGGIWSGIIGSPSLTNFPDPGSRPHVLIRQRSAFLIHHARQAVGVLHSLFAPLSAERGGIRTPGTIARTLVTSFANDVTGFLRHRAEEAGFEPAIPCGMHAFQACAFNHSATLPL